MRNMSNNMATAHASVIAAADKPAVMLQLLNHGNPAVRRAGELLKAITDMHARNDYNHAREMQIADDVLSYLPMPEIQNLMA